MGVLNMNEASTMVTHKSLVGQSCEYRQISCNGDVLVKGLNDIEHVQGVGLSLKTVSSGKGEYLHSTSSVFWDILLSKTSVVTKAMYEQ